MSTPTTATAVWDVIRAAMVSADTDTLSDVLAESFTLTHMTGFVQSHSDWLAAIDTADMQYHRIVDVDLVASPDGDAVTVRTRTDATIWGGRGQWPLQLRIDVDVRRQVATRMIATTW